MTITFDLNTFRNIAICFIFAVLFGTAAHDKVKSFTTPDWFVKQFDGTLIAKMPGGAAGGYWMIAMMESALTFAFTASAVKVEILPYALCGAMFLFGALLIGLRVTKDYQGSANMFIYFGAALISFSLVHS